MKEDKDRQKALDERLEKMRLKVEELTSGKHDLDVSGKTVGEIEKELFSVISDLLKPSPDDRSIEKKN